MDTEEVGIERRAIVRETELRFLPPAVDQRGVTVGTLTGYAAVYNRTSVPMGTGGRRFVEQIAPGAFRSALSRPDNVFAYFNHGVAGGIPEAALPLGSTHDGSLRLKDDGLGLRFELDLPDTTDGRNLAVMVQRGTVKGVSFGFNTSSTKKTLDQRHAPPLVTLHDIAEISDISPTHNPAYPDTSVSMRSVNALFAEEETKATAALEDEKRKAEAEQRSAGDLDRRQRRTRLLEIEAGVERRSVDSKNEDASDGGADDDTEMRSSDAERPDSDFAAVYMDGDTKVRKLPIYDADHVRNALARLDQTDLPESEKTVARKRLEAAARKFGIGDY